MKKIVVMSIENKEKNLKYRLKKKSVKPEVNYNTCNTKRKTKRKEK